MIEAFKRMVEAFKVSTHSYVTSMKTTHEDSPFHREESVFAHTLMVCDQLMSRWESGRPTDNGDRWDQAMLLAGIAAIFHDIGKPIVEEHVVSEERGAYRRYLAHERSSTSVFRWVWHDVDSRTAILGHDVPELTAEMYGAVCLMIGHHLPYNYGTDLAVGVLRALDSFGSHYAEAFTVLLMSDAMGRITDDPHNQGKSTQEWIDRQLTECDRVEQPTQAGDKRAYVLIGPQGCGKSTFYKSSECPNCAFSMDEIRIMHFGDGAHNPESYQRAWLNATNDKVRFNSTVNREIHKLVRSGQPVIFSDNMNLNKKSRRQFITAARRAGYHITAIVFDYATTLNDLRERNNSRTDHKIPDQVIQSCYDRLHFPSYDEVDRIVVI